MPALIRTIHLGYVTLALEERTEAIGYLLGETKQEMLRMNTVLDKLARNAQTLSTSIEEARRRTRVVSRKLNDIDITPQDITEITYEIDSETGENK